MLNKVNDYTIVHATEADDVVGKVKQAMDKGWVPSGPLLLDSRQYLQVMVKFGG